MPLRLCGTGNLRRSQDKGASRTNGRGSRNLAIDDRTIPNHAKGRIDIDVKLRHRKGHVVDRNGLALVALLGHTDPQQLIAVFRIDENRYTLSGHGELRRFGEDDSMRNAGRDFDVEGGIPIEHGFRCGRCIHGSRCHQQHCK